jgi:hypothetical protein
VGALVGGAPEGGVRKGPRCEQIAPATSDERARLRPVLTSQQHKASDNGGTQGLTRSSRGRQALTSANLGLPGVVKPAIAS